MKFYYRVMNELRDGERSLRHIYEITFSFSGEVYVEESDGMDVREYTYGQCQRDVERVSSVLLRRFSDLPEGAPVGLRLKNSRAWIVLFWSLIRAGFSPLLLVPSCGGDTVAHCAETAGMRVFLSDENCGGADFADAAELMAAEPEEILPPRWGDRIILPTSGTTGEIKLFGYSGRAIAAQILNSRWLLDQNADVRRFYKGKLKHLVILPFCHIFGLTAVLLWFGLYGRTFVLPRDLRPDTILATARYHNVTHVFAVPLLWDSLADGILREAKKTKRLEKLEKGARLSLRAQNAFPALGRKVSSLLFRSVQDKLLGRGVSIAITGGGSPRPETMRLVSAVGYPLHNGYGMTEIGITSVDLRRRPADRMGLSVGRPLPSVRYELRPDPELGGELLWVRGESCFTERFEHGRAIPHGPDEWYCTGDHFRADEAGNYYFVGRSADMVNASDGELVSLVSVEERIRPDFVRAACCVGLPRPDGTAEICYLFEPAGLFPEFREARLMAAVEAANADLPLSRRIRR
ncbi:MAG: acyl--CoA ligase, partial [Oscillospiraceae bacterium]|nr:acyl--CoA ligase [Oscillospiraceae bacterium]